MTDVWAFTIPGPPPVCRRARAALRGRHIRIYQDAHTDADEDRVALAARVARLPRLVPPLEVAVDAYFPRPARRPEGIPADVWALGCAVRRPVKPDKDNVEKAILDGMTRAGVWADDSIADGAHCRRWYCARGGAPRTVVTVRQVGWLSQDVTTEP